MHFHKFSVLSEKAFGGGDECTSTGDTSSSFFARYIPLFGKLVFWCCNFTSRMTATAREKEKKQKREKDKSVMVHLLSLERPRNWLLSSLFLLFPVTFLLIPSPALSFMRVDQKYMSVFFCLFYTDRGRGRGGRRKEMTARAGNIRIRGCSTVYLVPNNDALLLWFCGKMEREGKMRDEEGRKKHICLYCAHTYHT